MSKYKEECRIPKFQIDSFFKWIIPSTIEFKEQKENQGYKLVYTLKKAL